MAEIILASIDQIQARSARANGNEVIIFQDSADISVAQPGYLVLSPTSRHFEHRRGEGPGDEVVLAILLDIRTPEPALSTAGQ